MNEYTEIWTLSTLGRHSLRCGAVPVRIRPEHLPGLEGKRRLFASEGEAWDFLADRIAKEIDFLHGELERVRAHCPLSPEEEYVRGSREGAYALDTLFCTTRSMSDESIDRLTAGL